MMSIDQGEMRGGLLLFRFSTSSSLGESWQHCRLKLSHLGEQVYNDVLRQCGKLRFADGLFRDQFLEMPLYANRLANGLQIHQIVKVPQNI